MLPGPGNEVPLVAARRLLVGDHPGLVTGGTRPPGQTVRVGLGASQVGGRVLVDEVGDAHESSTQTSRTSTDMPRERR